MNEKELCALAVEQRKNAYCPYSHFAVGCALSCQDGTVYLGSNIENASYTPTVCAERVAFFKAVSEGKRDFCQIAIATGTQNALPCGVCLQVMSEFCSPDFTILSVSGDGTFEKYRLGDLLPHAFTLEKR